MGQREFYFVRHGQTDFNLNSIYNDKVDVPLNRTGKIQARKIRPKIREIGVSRLYVSPMTRARETAVLIAPTVSSCVYEDSFKECSDQVWREIEKYRGSGESLPDEVASFVKRVNVGIQRVIKDDHPALVVSHGGVFWGVCYNLCITPYQPIDNCAIYHIRFDGCKWVGSVSE